MDREGRTRQHGAYVFPSRVHPLLRWSLLVAVLLPVLLIGLFFVGAPMRPGQGGAMLRTALVPGPNSSRHSLATTDCVQCHREGRNVEDVRCERCHDVSVSARLSNAAHVFQGSGDLRRAIDAPVVQCATCHVEHRGAEVNLADVDDRECGSCHRAAPNALTALTSLTKHPEFALVREGSETGSGLRWFNHAMHVPKVQAKFQKACEACHERSPQGAAFMPIAFPRHCATCHEADLSDSAGTISAAGILALGPLPAPLQTRPDPDDPGRQSITGFKHADPWIMTTVQALRRTLDPASVDAERITLDGQLAQLELLESSAGPGVGSGAWTGLLPASTTGAMPGSPRSIAEGVRESAAAIESFLMGLGVQDDASRALLAEAVRMKQTPGGTVPPPASARGGGVEPVRQLLSATMARAQAAGNADLVQRARALLARLDALPAGTRRPAASSAAAGSVQGLLQNLGTAGDPGVRAEVARLTYLAQMAQRQAGSGIDPASFDLHRLRILRLLDAVQATLRAPRPTGAEPGDVDRLLTRVAALRRRILGTGYGVPPDSAHARAQFFRNRQENRARVDTELDAAALRTPAPPERPTTGMELWRGRLAQLRVALAAVGPSPRQVGSLAPDETRRVIAALIGTEAQDAETNSVQKNRCTLCHEVAAGTSRLAPVRAAGGSLLLKAAFTHAPHVSADNRECDSCHTSIRTSTSPRDVNLPGVASCVTCHAPGKQAARATGCEACHKYHADSRTALVWTP